MAQKRNGLRVGRVLCQRFHCRSRRAGFKVCAALEIQLRDFVQAHGKVELREPLQAFRQLINHIVFDDGARAVAAFAFHFQQEALINLFARLHGIEKLLATTHRTATAFVQAIVRLKQAAMIFDEPVYAVESAAFFVRRQCDDDVAVWRKAFLFEANQIRHKKRRHRFVIRRAAPVVIAVLL